MLGELIAVHAHVNALGIELQNLEHRIATVLVSRRVQTAFDKALLTNCTGQEAEIREEKLCDFHAGGRNSDMGATVLRPDADDCRPNTEGDSLGNAVWLRTILAVACC